MRTRAAAALHKVLTFQDVRARVADTPSIVASLVGLLRQQDVSRSRGLERSGQTQEEGVSARERGSGPQSQPLTKKKAKDTRSGAAGCPIMIRGTEDCALEESCELSRKVCSSSRE